MQYQIAKKIADKYVEFLSPYCERIEIGGSLRRKKENVGDIEIISIPSEINGNRFPEFINFVNNLTKVRGEPTGKYTQRMLPEGIALDLFMASENNWGMIFPMRTGSRDFSHYKLACRWVAMGYKSIGGCLHKGNEVICFREEQDLFDFLGIEFVLPEKR